MGDAPFQHFVLHGAGHTLADFSVSNDTEGANTLIQKLLKTAEKNQCEHIKIGLEATDQYSWHIAHYLKCELKGDEPSFQSTVYMLNARKVSRFKKGYDTLPKTIELTPG